MAAKTRSKSKATGRPPTPPPPTPPRRRSTNGVRKTSASAANGSRRGPPMARRGRNWRARSAAIVREHLAAAERPNLIPVIPRRTSNTSAVWVPGSSSESNARTRSSSRQASGSGVPTPTAPSTPPRRQNAESPLPDYHTPEGGIPPFDYRDPGPRGPTSPVPQSSTWSTASQTPPRQPNSPRRGIRGPTSEVSGAIRPDRASPALPNYLIPGPGRPSRGTVMGPSYGSPAPVRRGNVPARRPRNPPQSPLARLEQVIQNWPPRARTPAPGNINPLNRVSPSTPSYYLQRENLQLYGLGQRGPLASPTPPRRPTPTPTASCAPTAVAAAAAINPSANVNANANANTIAATANAITAAIAGVRPGPVHEQAQEEEQEEEGEEEEDRIIVPEPRLFFGLTRPFPPSDPNSPHRSSNSSASASASSSSSARPNSGAGPAPERAPAGRRWYPGRQSQVFGGNTPPIGGDEWVIGGGRRASRIDGGRNPYGEEDEVDFGDGDVEEDGEVGDQDGNGGNDDQEEEEEEEDNDAAQLRAEIARLTAREAQLLQSINELRRLLEDRNDDVVRLRDQHCPCEPICHCVQGEDPVDGDEEEEDLQEQPMDEEDLNDYPPHQIGDAEDGYLNDYFQDQDEDRQLEERVPYEYVDGPPHQYQDEDAGLQPWEEVELSVEENDVLNEELRGTIHRLRMDEEQRAVRRGGVRREQLVEAVEHSRIEAFRLRRIGYHDRVYDGRTDMWTQRLEELDEAFGGRDRARALAHLEQMEYLLRISVEEVRSLRAEAARRGGYRYLARLGHHGGYLAGIRREIERLLNRPPPAPPHSPEVEEVPRAAWADAVER